MDSDAIPRDGPGIAFADVVKRGGVVESTEIACLKMDSEASGGTFDRSDGRFQRPCRSLGLEVAVLGGEFGRRVADLGLAAEQPVEGVDVAS